MIKLHELSTPLVTHTLQVIGTELYRKSLQKIQQIYKKDGGAFRAADLIEFYSDVGYEHLIPSYYICQVQLDLDRVSQRRHPFRTCSSCATLELFALPSHSVLP